VVQEIVDNTPIGNYTERLAEAEDKRETYKPKLFAPEAKILIVDDNEMNLEVLNELIKDTKIKITTALSGKECIEYLKAKKFDMVLLDQMMPGMSGTQTLEIITREHLADGTPVIALTADAIVGARDAYIREGFNDYLSKPVMYSELERILEKYLNKSLIVREDVNAKEEAEKPTILVINKDADKLKELKEILADSFKGVYVKDEASAEKYLSKHKVDMILREGNI
jgi:CheY-like chemotaxis protein